MHNRIQLIVPETGEVNIISFPQAQRMFTFDNFLIDEKNLILIQEKERMTFILIFENLSDLNTFTKIFNKSNGYENQEDETLFPISGFISEIPTTKGRFLKESNKSTKSPIMNRFTYGLLPPNARI